jgi:hypothetical protein
VTGLTFVSVVYEAELALQRLQARSMAVQLPTELAGAVLVIDNTAAGLPVDYRRDLLADYGPLAPVVRVLRPADICTLPRAVGWRSQQVLKLAVAEQVGTDQYVVLDAKNHAVAPLRAEYFTAADGRARVTAYGYRDHPLRPALEHVLGYLGLDPAPYVDRFTATVTPFVLDTAAVREMMADLQRRAGREFAREFIARDLTEFFLYAGWRVAQGRSLDEIFDLDQRPCPTVWPKGANPAGVRAAIARAAEQGTPLFAVHRRALAVLDAESRRLLAEFWTGRGLFAATEQAESLMQEFQRSYRTVSRSQRRRELPRRLGALPRKVRRRLGRRLRRRLGHGLGHGLGRRPAARR